MTDDSSARNENLTGCFLGYDPGGKKGHGVAAIKVASGEVADHRVGTRNTVEEVLQWFQHCVPSAFGPVLGIGIDTLTYWSGGWAGWRMADQCLRLAYAHSYEHGGKSKDVANSVASPNSLFGSMCLNGMFVLRRLRSTINGLYVTETHPKVLYFGLKNAKETDTEKKTYNYGQELHDWLANKIQWTRQKRKEINRGLKITDNEHQWDALISAWAAFCGLSGKWPLNLLNEAHCRELLKKTLCPEIQYERWEQHCDKLVKEHRPEEKWDFSGKNAEAENAKTEGAETLEFPGGPVEYRWPHPNHS